MTVHAPIQADFSYGDPQSGSASMPLSVSIYADRGHVRDTIRDDARAAGFTMRECAAFGALLDGVARPLADVILLDCPQVDAEALATLSRLDMRAANCGARLIVSTTVDCLDEVFACLDQSNPQFLVNPTRADRVIALGQLLGTGASRRLRELSEEDRMALLRLTEQVGKIAERLNRMELQVSPEPAEPSSYNSFDLVAPSDVSRTRDEGTLTLLRSVRPALPDPRLVRRIIRQRQLRGRFFESELFSDPAWDMLLDLTAARAEHTRVSVTSLCIASGVPPTTALRWIAQMTDAGLFERVEDDADRRRAFIALTERAADNMARYFAELGKEAAQLV